MDEILRMVAEQNGVTVVEVYSEIQNAIKSGQNNPDPSVQSLWQKTSPGKGESSVEEVIKFIINEIEK